MPSRVLVPDTNEQWRPRRAPDLMPVTWAINLNRSVRRVDGTGLALARAPAKVVVNGHLQLCSNDSHAEP